MTLRDISRRAQGQHTGVRFVAVLLIAGVMIEMVALITGLALGVSIGDYFSATKATRDAATSGSGLLSQIGTISAVKAWIAPLQILGVATLFAAIAVSLAVIIENLQLRAEAFAAALPVLINGGNTNGDDAGGQS